MSYTYIIAHCETRYFHSLSSKPPPTAPHIRVRLRQWHWFLRLRIKYGAGLEDKQKSFAIWGGIFCALL